jgi:acyl carrier protein
MNLSDLFAHLESEFELDIPEDAEETMLCVRDIRDYICDCYRDQGMELPASAIFERVRRTIAVWAKVDVMKIQPQTRLTDIVPKSDMLIWG